MISRRPAPKKNVGQKGPSPSPPPSSLSSSFFSFYPLLIFFLLLILDTPTPEICYC